MPTVTNATVVSTAYDTAKGRLTRLTNGLLVAGARDGNLIHLYKSINGTTWTSFYSVSWTSLYDFVIGAHGDSLYMLVSASSSITFKRINTDTGADITSATVDSSQTLSSLSGCALAISTTGILTAVWTSKNATYPDSENIRSAKSSNSGSTWTKQNGTAGVDQITDHNDPFVGHVNPTAVYNGSDNPVLMWGVFNNNSNYNSIRRTVYNAGWGFPSDLSIYFSRPNDYPYVIREHSASPHANRLWCAWQGKDDVDTNKYNICMMYSDDGGLTWSNGGVSGYKVTSGNTYDQLAPSITCDKAGNVYVLWHEWYDGVVIKPPGLSLPAADVKKKVWNGSSWGSTTTVNSPSCMNVSALYDPAFSLNFSQPLFIYKDYWDDSVEYHGTWTLIPPDVWCNIGGAWKKAESVYVNIGGTWKEVESVKVNVGGAWKDS